MLARQHRFHRRNAVRFVYRKGAAVRGNLISAHVVFDQRHNSYRIAVVVSKKVSKKAVIRNRIRRRVYELVRTNNNLLPAGCDIILTIFNENIATMPAQQLEAELVELLNKVQSKK